MQSDDNANLLLKKTLSYANGYRELGMYIDALDELARLPESLAYHLDVLQMRLAILIDANDWAAAACAANDLTLREPQNPAHFVNLAFATRRAESIEKAKSILDEASLRFPNEAIIHYNLGCYTCQEKRYDLAKEHLAKAFSLDPKFLNTAKSDSDLAELSTWIEALELS